MIAANDAVGGLMLAILALAFILLMVLSINTDINEHEDRQSHKRLLKEIRQQQRDAD